MTRALLLLPLALLAPSGANGPVRAASAQGITAPEPAPVPLLAAQVVARYPHDPRAFTEGLLYSDGALYESVGQEGRSEVRRVRLADGKVLARAAIPPAQFGEGLARWRSQLVSLTWHEGIAHRWDVRTLRPLGDSRYSGEGWGLAGDGDSLWLSDGSATVRRLDARSFAETGRVTVTLNGRAVEQVNELEMVDGALLANVWHTPFLVRIDPASGRVTALVDLRPLVAEVRATDPEAVPNGIAWDAKGRRLFVTGKLWPTLFEVKLVAAAPVQPR